MERVMKTITDFAPAQLDPYDERFMRGAQPEVSKPLFHGGCVGCAEQRVPSMSTCVGCCFYQADWTLPDRSRTEAVTI